MRSAQIVFSFFIAGLFYVLAIGNTGCGQIGMPTGGPRDSIPPRLVSASPALKSTNVKGNKITLTFNEYVDLKNVQTAVLISPYPKKSPIIDFKLKTVTVKLRDSLLPNTTYSINFGDAIVDNNEGNPYRNFTYVFSTGNQIDSFVLTGKVVLAETGKADSTLIALLYRPGNDSAVQKNKPDYVSRLSGDGSFSFVHLPAGSFNLYALKDGDGSKTYNSKKEIFAFADASVSVSENTEPVLLYASAVEKEKPPAPQKPTVKNKKLVYNLTPQATVLDLLGSFELSFNAPLQNFDPAKLILRDTNYKAVPPGVWSIDSSRTKISLRAAWQEGMAYRLIIDSTAFSDSSGNRIALADTIKLKAKDMSDYGHVVLRFSNLELGKKPVLQFVQGEEIKYSYPLIASEWSNTFINPGEYELRILFDSNSNGKWDPGDYSKKLQPEKAITLSQKLGVRANWDNERDIKL
ncbi:MAG: Ig-like domain-containing protein [Ferruginibacter sp.]